MAANSQNKNGSNWVTARHGGDGKGKAGSGPAPNPVNHHGAVNANKGPQKKKSGGGSSSTDTKKEGKEDTSPKGKSEGDDEEAEGEEPPSLHPYHKAVADELRTKHGLSHNASVRVGAGVVAAHAKGHASVDSDTQSAASEAHAHFQGMLKKHKKHSAVSAPQRTA